MFTTHPVKPYPRGFTDITLIKYISNILLLLVLLPVRELIAFRKSRVAFQRRRMSVGARWAFTVFWVLLISLYSQQTDEVLAADNQSVGQPLRPCVYEASKHTHTHTHTGAVKADPAGVYFYTKHEEEGEVRRRCVVANDADPSLVTKRDFGNDFPLPDYCSVTSCTENRATTVLFSLPIIHRTAAASASQNSAVGTQSKVFTVISVSYEFYMSQLDMENDWTPRNVLW